MYLYYWKFNRHPWLKVFASAFWVSIQLGLYVMFHCHLFHIHAFLWFCTVCSEMVRDWTFCHGLSIRLMSSLFSNSYCNYWLLFHCSNNASLFIINVPFYFHRRLQFEATDPSAYTAVYFVTSETLLSFLAFVQILIFCIILIQKCLTCTFTF